MVSIYDVDATKLITAVAEKLKKSIEMPAWALFVKTGVHRQRPPVNNDWWFIRAAAILRTIYRGGPIGISKLRSKYGGGKDRGRAPSVFKKGSGKIIRTAIQQLEAAGFLKKADKGKGRLITPLGQSLLEKTATEIYSKPSAKVDAPIEIKQKKAKEPKIAPEVKVEEKTDVKKAKGKKAKASKKE